MAGVRAKISISASRTLHHIIILLFMQFFIKFSQGQGPGESKFFNIFENNPPETLVGSIDTRSSYTYSLNDGTLGTNEFRIDPSNGRIFTKFSLDRDSLNVSQDTFHLLIIGRSSDISKQSYPIEVSIQILDKNDNAPVFPSPSILINILESSHIGFKEFIPTASDSDAGINQEIANYTFISGKGPFKLLYDPDVYGQVLFIQTTGELDRETKDNYEFIIAARDRGVPPLTGQLQVNINIQDANDNPPIFDPSEYFSTVNETDPLGTFVIRVIASDRDLGKNGDVTYNFLEENTVTTQFRIDERTGEIFTAKEPLYCVRYCGIPPGSCNPNSCLLTIEAKDGGIPQYTGRAFVYITVIDRNNHDPTITVEYKPDGNTQYSLVNEDAKQGDIVATITAEDRDVGVYGKLSIVQIISGNDLRHFVLLSYNGYQSNILQVSGDNLLDREQNYLYNLTVEAADQGSPPRKTQKSIVIYINDVNDHTPAFQFSTYTVTLSELTPVGSFVASCLGTDLDSGDNAKLTYTILIGNELNWFLIDEETGLVTTQAKLEFEVRSQFVMNISVHDGALKPLYNYTMLSVFILDENDMAPQFEKEYFNVTIKEGLPSGSLVIIASAEDNDSDINGTIVYEFYSDVAQKYPSTFNIESNSGRVTTATVLDRESISEYTFRIIAKDRAIVPLTSVATVHLEVLDVNDDSPQFYPTLYFASVDNGQAGPVKLVQVTAVDRDAGENGQVVYSMVGMDASKFSLDSATGWISTINVLNRTVQSKYTLGITARDKPGLNAINSATVEIVVTLPGDVVPRFLEESVERSINEDADNQQPAIGSPVYQVTAVTSPSNVLVSFAITDGDPKGVFSINASTGWIVRAKKIDREDTSLFKLKVTARTSTQFNSTLVTIKINDANDNPPAFTTSSLDADLIENWPVGHGIVRTVAVDKDEGVNARVTYTLQTNPSDVFAMESDTGLLSLKKPVKLLTSTLVQLIVTARDSGTPQLSATQTVTLHFQDVNDHTPTFARSTFETSLIESRPMNDKFYGLKAYDGDVGKNAEVLYTITRGNEDRAFGIFPDGFLYIAKELDRETKDIYKLTVLATDKGIPPRSSECNVTIYIMDENDNKPILVKTAYNMSVNENAPLKTYVGIVNASDADMGRNGEISYFLSSAQDGFSIDVETGEIFTAKQFDRELLFERTGKNYIIFDVIAKDNGIKRLQATASVKVYIEDVNDNLPQFNKSVYDVSVSEDAAMFTYIAEIRAYDKDAGNNALLTYRIVNGNTDDKFEINSFTGQLSRKQGLLDRETEDHYTFSVIATDSGFPVQNSATTIVSITVLDVNDNEPTFDQSAFEAEVLEDIEPGKSIAQFFATDIDLGLNAAITYFISGADDDGTFGIDKHTGKMFLLKKLDYEKKKEYKLNVTAIDSGIPPLSSYTKFRIIIRDVNDNQPVFQKVPIFAHIQEGSSQTPDIYATAIDADSAENQVIRYSILHQEPGNLFKILPNTGLLYIDSPIDAKYFDLINITVVATDQANQTNKRLSAETVVTIFVDDINNNSPTFVSFSSIIIPANTPRNTYITVIEASDPDRGKNGTVSMTLDPGLYSDLFSLESSSGRLYLVRTLTQILPTFNITVRAQDRGPNPRETVKQFRVIISAESQNGPVFWNASYAGNVDENSPKGREILTVKATAPGGNTVEYYVTNITLYDTGVQVESYFEMDPTSGKLYTNVVLDRETMGGKFRVEIYAMDTNVSRTTKIQAEVTVNDQNDTPPKFSSGYYKVALREDVIVGYTILTLSVDDPDTIGGLFMTIIDGNDGSFKIDQDGAVVTSRKLDRELVSQYTLRIQASDGSQVSYTTIIVYLNDVNDNAPQFTQSMYSIDIPEDTPIGTTMEGVRATDLDEGVNKRIRYYFASEWGNDTFFLDAERGLFITQRVLDFEENQLYTLKIGAMDGGSPALSSTVIVYMNILDVNDNTPVFDPQSYSKEVREDVKVDTSLLQVFATDVDSGSDGEVRFSIASGDDFGWFRIDPVTGKIFNTKSLDRESTPNGIILTVMATDQALIHPLSSTVQVNITLRDVNDYAPKFVSPSTIYVNENTLLNTVVFTVNTIDLDQGDNGRVEYSLAITAESPFSISQTTGNLKVSMILDRETVQNYTLFIIATDQGSPQLSSTQTLTVVIEDDNDNAPIFSQPVYQLTVPEDVKIGSTLLQATAIDADAGLNGTVLYFIIGGDDNSEFIIDQSSGLLRVQKQIDFERVQEYNLIIQAEDSGPETKYATATVSVTVQDVNDNAPRFVNSPFIGYVRENMDNVPVQVIQVSASDDDSSLVNQVNYAIRDGDRTIFSLNSSSGEILALKSLDREQKADYILTVIATDSVTSRGLTGSGTVRVIVEDVNDNPPVFEHSGIYTAHVRENLPPSASVLNVRATDADESVNAQLIYYIKDGAGLPFTVFPDTGLLTTTQRLDRETQDKYVLEIIAHDASLIPLSSTATVTVIVDDENDNAPQFDRPSYSKTIINSAPNGSFILGVTAVDSDAGDNGRIIYSISMDSLNFAINQQTGVITAVRNLTVTGTTYSLQVTATDKGQPSKNSVVSVSVQITASSSNKSPIFNTVASSILVRENSDQGKVVTTVTAQSVQNGVMMYYIAGGNIARAFSINETTGTIQVSRVIDYEMIREYHLWIEARESGNPSISGYKEVVILIEDVNDNAPQFSQPVYDASIAENVNFDTPVIKVQAFDADDGQNKLFTYNIANETHSDVFYIDELTGVIHTGKTLDRETVDFYSIIIIAVDQGLPKQTSSATVRINVTDLNDNQPKFTSMFSVKIPENLPVGSSILRVTSTDADIGQNAVASYSLADNASGRFAIDSSSGSITLLKQLDADNMTNDYYNLRLIANNGAFIVSGNAIVFVDDVNDNTPLLRPPFEFSLLEQQPIGTFIGILSALDKDVKSPNNKTYYSLNLPSTEFSLNSENGTLMTLKEMTYFRALDKSSQVNRYELVVITRDLGTPSRSSEQTIVINIIDRNDNPPVFEKSYFSAVPKTIEIGKSILFVSARDDLDYGLNAEVMYSVAGGNGSTFFQVDSVTGIVSVAVPLTNQEGNELILIIRATDKGLPPQQSTTPVKLVITGVNNYAPIFEQSITEKTVGEDISVGTTIVTFSATDKDMGLNGEVMYIIANGDPGGLFSIGIDNGILKINKSLDYEKSKEHRLNITARDKAFFYKEASVIFTIRLIDVNDNIPVFAKSRYSVYVEENITLGSSVFQAIAYDADYGDNAIIRYSISASQMFDINIQTGGVTTLGALDYEKIQNYTITIFAANPGSNQKNIMELTIYVTGVNEFFPKFIQAIYDFTITENAAQNTPVGIPLRATDSDLGEDGIVYYYLVGSSNLKGFKINHTTGQISVAGPLDYESSTPKRITLEALAKNRGSIRGNDTDTCLVQISLNDTNDPPIFSRSIYQALIKENSKAGVSIITVVAADYDYKPEDRTFSYIILAGNAGNLFQINPQSGLIQTTGQGELDREKVSMYNVTVGAVDTGQPPETGSAVVMILLEDVNDNSPQFVQPNVAYVTENQVVGTTVARLAQFTTDPDTSTPPELGFLYTEVSGNVMEYSFFHIQPDGLVVTRAVIDREKNPSFLVPIIVSDMGSPRMSSTLTFTVIVRDINDNIPTARHLTSFVALLDGKLPTGAIANVKPQDQDLIGSYVCDIQTGDKSIFRVTPNSCNLSIISFPNSSSYVLRIQGSDGFGNVSYDTEIKFILFNNDTLGNTIVIRIENSTGEQFMEKSYTKFINFLKGQFSPSETVILYGLVPVNFDLLLFLAVKKPNQEYYNLNNLNVKISGISSSIQSAAGIKIKVVSFSPCLANPCNNGGECLNEISAESVVVLADSLNQSLSNPVLSLISFCKCLPQFTGPVCSTPSQSCGQVYCQNGAQCIINSDSSKYCFCTGGWEGNSCETDIDECLRKYPCQNEAACKNQPGSYECACQDGFWGKNCENGSNYCQSNPCNNGTCKNTMGNFTCICPYNQWGDRCQYSSIGFEEGSYMEFPKLMELNNEIDVVFASIKKYSLLLYNPSSIEGSTEFLALEIVNGFVRFSFALGYEEPTRLTIPIDVTTGSWFRVRVDRNRSISKIRVSACPTNQATCDDCQVGSSCYAEGSQNSDEKLDLGNQTMIIGGIKNITMLSSHFGQISTHDFVGCIRNFYINGLDKINQEAINKSGIKNVCPRSQSTSLCDQVQCKNEGICIDEWSAARCKCPTKYTGTQCEEKVEPFGFASGGYILIQPKESYRRDQLVSIPSRKKRSAPNESSTFIRFRKTSGKGVLLFTAISTAYTVLTMQGETMSFTVNQYGNFQSLTLDGISDGVWHNVTVIITADSIQMKLDDRQPKILTKSTFQFTSPDVVKLSLGGLQEAITVEEETFKDFDGCISAFQLDGTDIPLNGTTERYTVTVVGGVQKACSALCTSGGMCNENAKCTPNGETVLCLLNNSSTEASLSIGVIIVIAFFGVIIIVIIVAFIICRQRRMFCLAKKGPGFDNGHVKSVNNSGHSHQDSGFGEQLNEGDIIQSHIANELHTTSRFGNSGHLVRPDLIGSDTSGRLPLQMDDGTVIIDNASDLTNLRNLHDDAPEHYDLENASSIAPSDIDVFDHYRHFRDGKEPRHRHKPSHSHKQHDSSFHKNRDSPALVTSVPYMHDIARNNSPGVRNSPLNQLSRHNPSPLSSPLTHYNVNGMPVTELKGSHIKSDHSLASHTSRSSSSSVPAKPKRQMLPNGNTKQGNLLHNKKASHHYDNQLLKGLTMEEVDRLNSRPRESPASLQEAVSSSSENNNSKNYRKAGDRYHETNTLLDPPDTSSEDSANDSFTCSEFEYENEKGKNEFDPTSMIFSNLPEVENETDDGAHHSRVLKKSDGLDSGGNSFSSNVGSSDEGPGRIKPINGTFNWDDLLNWGPRFEKLVGVFTDIALLPDADNLDCMEGKTDSEEYV